MKQYKPGLVNILRWGINNTELLEEKIAFLQPLKIFNRAKLLAESNLPVPLATIPNLFIVAGGRAGAAAINNDIYLDVLNFTRSRSRSGRSQITETDVIEFFAHETHHVGFSEMIKRKRNQLWQS